MSGRANVHREISGKSQQYSVELVGLKTPEKKSAKCEKEHPERLPSSHTDLVHKVNSSSAKLKL